jgi:hypothetical protein
VIQARIRGRSRGRRSPAELPFPSASGGTRERPRRPGRGSPWAIDHRTNVLYCQWPSRWNVAPVELPTGLPTETSRWPLLHSASVPRRETIAARRDPPVGM